MANPENLIPFGDRPESEQRAIRLAGGYASGVARRRKKAMREAADLFLSLPPTDKRTMNRLIRAGLDPGDVDNQMAVISGMVQAALKGDARAARVLLEMLGDDTAPQQSSAEDDALSQSLEALGKELVSDDD